MRGRVLEGRGDHRGLHSVTTRRASDLSFDACYSASAAELAHAQRIVDAFAANPDAGALSIDGQMIDKPHLTQALRTLAAAG